MIRRLDPQQSCLKTVAVGAVPSDSLAANSVTECSAAEMKRLLRWASRDGVLRRGRRKTETSLRATRGKIEGPYGAARLLKIHPHTLRARMRKLGIAWANYRAPRPAPGVSAP